VLGRDPALRVIAERDGWRQLAIVGGRLRPLSAIAIEGTAIDDLLVEVGSAPIAPAGRDREPGAATGDDWHGDNVVPFPIAARSSGAR
jgi:hypothetical protein